MSNQKDASGLTKQERHDIIINYLKEINKPTKVFHLRWRPGDLLNGKILRSTPMFWYMKYQWSRPQIEEMFFKARIEIDDQFDRSLQQVFGGTAGARWRGGVVIPKQKKWKVRAEENARQWQGQQSDKVVSRDNVDRAVGDYNANLPPTDTIMRNKMAQNIGTKNREIWNAVSDFGADKSINYKTFSDNLKDRGINVSPLLAKQLFDQLAGPKGQINQQEMDAIVRQLDKVKLPSDFASVSWEQMSGKLGAQLVMKRVLLAASSGEPFNVDDFVFASKFGVNISPVQFMNKLTDRDVEWDDRVRSMEAVSANIGSNPLFNNLLADANIPELLCGWSTQMLDTKPEVQKTAIELMPNIFHESVEKGNPQIAVGHLEEILDNLFKVLDDPKCARNHPAAKDAVDKIVNDVIAMNDPESILYLAGLLSEKCDLENVTSAPARAFALEQIQKIMFGSEPAKTGKVDFANIPKPGSVNREWLDIGAKIQSAPSESMYVEPEPEYWGDESGKMGGKNYRPQQRMTEEKTSPQYGKGQDETMSGFPFDPAGPYAHVSSFPTNAMVNQPVKFDASKSHDCDRQPVKTYLWNFGDGSPEVTTTKPTVDHPYKKAEVYPVTVEVTDKYGKKAKAGLNQRVNDPKRILPPYAQLSSDPPTQHVKKPVKFDASKSHDGDKQPCVNFVFDFGDGSDPVSSPKPIVHHPYAKKGSYPVKVTVTDKHGQTADAFLTQRIIDPRQQDPTLPYAAVESTPKDPKPHQPVKFDASKSVDCDGDPVKNYLWEFGDFSPKVTTTKPVVNHAYAKPGTYPVKVTVTDKYNKSVPAYCKTMVIPSDPAHAGKTEIAPRLPPTVILTSNPQETVPMQPVHFDASQSHDYQGNPCVSFLWDFGDNTPKVTTKEPYTQHPYQESGTYPVTVVATDKFKQTGEAGVNQRVREPGPLDPYAAVSSTPNDPRPSQPVRIDASESVDHKGNPCKNFIFDFGDGSPPVTSTKPVVNHVYNEPGTYPVNVIVTDRYGKKGNASLNQRVTDPKNPIGPPHAHLASKPKETKVYEPVDFDASKSHDYQKMPCKAFVWDFGDGTPKQKTNGPYTVHKYANPGSYPVIVEVEDKHGQKATASVNQRVVPDPPFDGARKIPAVKPTNPARAQLIERHLPPYAGVRSNPTNADPKEKVLFDASESQDYTGDPPVEYLWDFGDGTPKVKTNKPKVHHAYDNPGSYPVNVTVVDKFHQKADASLTQRVKGPTIGPPYAALSSKPKETAPLEPVYFDASRSHDHENKPCVKFVWNFGDKSPLKTTDVPRTEHPYQKTGTYPVTVEVTDKHGQTANAKVTHPVTDTEPAYASLSTAPEGPYAAVRAVPSVVKPNQNATIDASESQDAQGNPCSTYKFDFGDGTEPVTSTKPVVVHKYAKTGTYPVKVTVTDKNALTSDATCTQRVDQPYGQSIGPPYAELHSKPKETKPKEPVYFDASKSHDADKKPCVSFLWDFGDRSPKVTTKGPHTTHPYQHTGTYPVTVEVTDKHGQTASASVTQRVSDPTKPAHASLSISPEGPYAAVRAIPTTVKPNQNATIDASESQDAQGNPCSTYKFDFGDGTEPVTTTKPVVVHKYAKAGTYPVKVTVTDKNALTSDATCTQRVDKPYGKSIGPPYAELHSKPKETKPKEPVYFDASKSHDADKKPCVSFLWDFGDNSPKQTTKGPHTTHPYQHTGTYPVTVEVTDKHGQTASASVTQRVSDPTKPAFASASTDPTKPAYASLSTAPEGPYAAVRAIPSTVKPNQNATIDASESQDAQGNPCSSYTFDFGDGTQPVTTTKPVVVHKYMKAGTYPVKVTVTDKNALTSDATCTQRVDKPYGKSIGPPYAELHSNPKETKPMETVYFDASKSHDADKKPCVSFLWDFGDNSPKQTTKGPHTTHPYQHTGTYPVTVEVTDKHGQTASASVTQRVSDPTKPAFASASTDPTKPAFASTSTDPMAPYAGVRALPSTVKPNQNATIDASESQDAQGNPCSSYTFDFGDGTPPVTSTKPVIIHKYVEPGTYPVKCTVTDRNALTSDATCTQRVDKPYGKSIGPPYAELHSNPKETKPMETVYFDASKSHDADKKPCVSFLWDFGDNSPKQTTKGPHTTHPYKHTGTYPVTVEVTDKHGQTASASVTQRVHDDMEEKSPMKGKRYRSQQHADEVKPQYYGGVGAEENMESDSTKPARTGKVIPYKPMDPYASVRSNPTSAKPKEQVSFDASDSQDADGDPPLEYNWNFGDGTPSVKTNKPFVNHAYHQPGSYPVKMTCVDKWGNPAHAQCEQRVINPQNPKIGKPYAALSSAPKETLPYEPVKFDASKSHSATGEPLVAYKWDFGDGTPMVETKTPVTEHDYERPGTYPVTVDVVDKHGQTAQAKVAQRVTVEDPFDRCDNDPLAPPIAHLQSTPKTAYPKQQVTFDASQSHDMDGGPCVLFEWDFGDGSPNTTTKEPITQHPYQRIGHYPTTVTVTDKHGQKDKAHTNTEVTDTDPAKTSRVDMIRPPVAVLESCPKETYPKEPVDFDASKSKDMYGKPCVSYTWDFGDKSPQKTTKIPLTKHRYQQIGYYPVTVTVKDKNGLTDKASVQQKVSTTIPSKNSTEWDPIISYQSIAPVKKTDPAYASMIDSIYPPFAALEGNPKVTVPNELVDFDASRSHDYEGKPCVSFTFDFGDGSPNVTQKGPYVKHPYKRIGPYNVTVEVTDKNGLKGKAHCNQKVIDSDPSSNSRIDKIAPPYAHVIGIPPETRPNVLVDFDASQSKDMYDKPCVSFLWDYGDGSPNETTPTPFTKHAYKQIGHYPVTVTVTDTNGLTGKASCNEKVSENIPPYQGLTDVPQLDDFGRKDNDELKDEPTFDRMDPEELGDEFRGVTSDAISKALMDPNRLNSRKAKQIADVMKQLNPEWPDELDPEAKRRYNKFNFPMKPHKMKLPARPKIAIPAADKEVHIVDLGMKVDFGSFEPPDI